jgi:ribosome-binding factor A
MSERMPQVNERIQRVLAEVLSTEAEIPSDFFISVTKVKCAPNLRHALIFVSVLPFAKSKEALEFLTKNRKLIQGFFGGKINLKYTPILEYKLDETEEITDQIYSIIDNL